MGTDLWVGDRADLSGMSPSVDDDDPDLSPLGPGMGPRATAREGVAAGEPPVQKLPDKYQGFDYHQSVGPILKQPDFQGIDLPDLRRELSIILGSAIVAVGLFIIGAIEWFDRRRHART